ncbi:MAG: EAL domain-containing protein [Xanthobacteraceae bacterium]
MSVAVSDRPARARQLATPRLVATLALFVLSATLFCAVVGHVLVRQAEDRQGLERRAALLGAIEDIRRSGAEFSALDPRHIRGMERTAGLKGLRFETEPDTDAAAGERELQSVLDRNGRIAGWFSWQPDRSMSNALGQLKPLLALTAFLLVGFAGIALWQVRRALADLASSEELAWKLAHEDVLTGLPNHRKIVELIDGVLAARADGEVVTLAYIDLDGLKDINDAFGQRSGDELLIALAARLKAVLPERAACGRFDGDEFAVVLTAPDMAAAEAAIAGVVHALARPYWIDQQAVQLGATTGLAHAPRDAQSRDELIRRADLALRAAKRKRCGGTFRFEPAMEVEFDDRRFLERKLRRALDDGALDVHYQPIVSADGARIVGAEALLRWDHPLRGAVPPAQFVAVAEHCGLMARLGEFVLRRALSDARRWPELYVAVNLSPVQVRDPALLQLVAGTLAENGMPASRLLLEVTEGVLIDNPAEAKVRLDALRGLGVRLALDDFGTAYSSLTYLQRFHFDKLKIDRGFVEPLGRERNSQAMIQAIVALGRALDLSLLAEGVETEQQRVLLRLAGCEEMQGFLFARPAPRETLDRLLRDARAPAGAVRPGLQPSVHPGVHPGVHPSVHPSVHPGVRPSVHPGVRPSVHPGVRPSVRPAAA